jgi:peroxiredoxin-like protein
MFRTLRRRGRVLAAFARVRPLLCASRARAGIRDAHQVFAMHPFPHCYDAQLIGGPSGYGEVTTGGVPPLRSAPPAQFGGPGDAWSPEHLLLAAVETCFLFTLRAVARASGVEFSTVAVSADGTVDRIDGVTRFTNIVLHVRAEIPAASDEARMRQVIDKSEHACLVSASLSTPVRLDVEIHAAVGVPAASR